jgi:hypothetical protein
MERVMNKPDYKAKPAPNRLTQDKPPNFESYKAYGKFTPLYDHAKDRIWECYPLTEARHTLAVLDALGWHANNLGVMYRLGYRPIMKRCHLRYQYVKDALLRLVYELDYLREHRIVIPTRKTDMVDWQLNPRVLWIAQPSIEQAESLWSAAKVPHVSVWETQPESEPDPEHRPRNQNLTRIPTRNSPQGKGRFQEVAIERCQVPIPIASAESLAQAIVKTMLTHESQARQMILTYGENQVRDTMTEVRNQMSRRTIQRPAGLLVQLLRTKYGKRAAEGEAPDTHGGMDSQVIPDWANSWGVDLSEVVR